MELLYSHFQRVANSEKRPQNSTKNRFLEAPFKKIIALFGPCGSGKTKSIELLAKWFNIKIIDHNFIVRELQDLHSEKENFKITNFQIFTAMLEKAFTYNKFLNNHVFILKHIPNISVSYIKYGLNEFWRRNRTSFSNFQMETLVLLFDNGIFTQNICDKIFPFWMLRNVHIIETREVGLFKLKYIWDNLDKNIGNLEGKSEFYGIVRFFKKASVQKKKEILELLKKSCFGDASVFLNQIYFEGIKIEENIKSIPK